ncbi:MAG: modification methylase, HemK family [Planctomycetaceae bacterium]|nr:modification methylase, HemK family [Planctomycetaceae bacterium]
MASSQPAPVESPEVWTVARILEWTTRYLKERGSETPRLDSEILLSHTRKCKRIQLYTNFDTPLTDAERAQMRDLVKRRANAEPVAYLVGHREFFGLDFNVTKDVLIPRPDTETLVVQLLERANVLAMGNSPPAAEGEAVKPAKNAAELRILELCTGSGCIAITAAVNLPKAKVLATDISPDALKIATDNATKHSVLERLEFRAGDLFQAVPDDAKFDLIASNPPYVPDGEIAGLDPDVRDHEPMLALRAGPDGMRLLTPIVENAGRYLVPGGWLLLETGIEQSPLTQQALESNAEFQEVRVVKDLAGRPRVVLAQRK